MRVRLEIQTTSQDGFIRLRRAVDLAALPNVGDRIEAEFWSEGVRVKSRQFQLDGGVLLDLGWHPFDDETRAGLRAQGWEPSNTSG